MSSFPPLHELVPHRPPMLLLDAIVAASEDEVACEATVRAGAPLVGVAVDADGAVSSLIALEYFAQAVAALYAYKARHGGAAFAGGVLLGVRELEMSAPSFAVGEVLRAECRETWSSGPVAQFGCTLLRHGERVATASITVLRGDPGALAHEFQGAPA